MAEPSAVGRFVCIALACAAVAAGAPSRPSCSTVSPARPAALAETFRPQGTPLVVHVWASWCRPCIAEWPSLARFLRELDGRGVRLVTLSLDDESGAATATRVLRQAGAPGCGMRADADSAVLVLRRLDPEWDGALPTTLVLDANGRLVLAQRGATDTAGLRAALERAASQAARSSRREDAAANGGRSDE